MEGSKSDAASVFATAQWVAAQRDLDTRTDKFIGSNIGGGPDTLASVFAGVEGERMLAVSSAAGTFGGNRYLIGRSKCQDTVDRVVVCAPDALSYDLPAVLILDSYWMAALDAGVTQFVILAAGLDSRPWRMPRLSSAVTVYEVDVAVAVEYKSSRLAESGTPPPACKRVTVAADLSVPTWPAALVGAGFDPARPSFFLVEGLLYYLPPDAPAALLRASAALMAPGSAIAGDIFLNFEAPAFLDSWRAPFTFDLPSEAAAIALLEDAGLSRASLVPSYTAFAGATPPKDTHLVFRAVRSSEAATTPLA